MELSNFILDVINNVLHCHNLLCMEGETCS